MLMIQFVLAMVIFPALIAMGLRVLSQNAEIKALKAQISDEQLAAVGEGDEARQVLVRYSKLA
ncbi:hypothetical protein [Salinibius halmophilus]|uniref:hypothetical protein n=1 Tax=Salinibius halmophilus TaxID=1853216 RepID=UPI000E675684|nr:hypothetical protein [Salinibius halmophilus]